MNINDLFPSRFLKAHDLGGKAFTLTIRDVTLEDVGHGAEKESKLTLAFERATKMMLLNRTNAMIIASMYGPETDAWLGKAVTIYSARVKAFGAWHDALRIKEQIPARNVGAAKMTDAMTEAPPLDDEDDLLDVDEGDEPRQDAPEPTQTRVEPSNGNTTHDSTVAPKWDVDADTGVITAHEGDVLFMPEPANSSSVPTDDELAITATWRGPSDAQAWALQVGACANKFHATESWLVSVRECGGYSSKNQAAVFVHFAKRQLEKLEQREMVVA